MTDSTSLGTHVSNALRTLLSETMFRADPRGGFILNRGEPGLVDTLKSLSAQTVSKTPRPGRKPIVSHANHVLFGLGLLNRAVHGDGKAFEGADWDMAWELVQVDDRQWADLLQQLDKTASDLLEAAPKLMQWSEIMLTGCFAGAAHTAYHLAAIRQILKDIENA